MELTKRRILPAENATERLLPLRDAEFTAVCSSLVNFRLRQNLTLAAFSFRTQNKGNTIDRRQTIPTKEKPGDERDDQEREREKESGSIERARAHAVTMEMARSPRLFQGHHPTVSASLYLTLTYYILARFTRHSRTF